MTVITPGFMCEKIFWKTVFVYTKKVNGAQVVLDPTDFQWIDKKKQKTFTKYVGYFVF